MGADNRSLRGTYAEAVFKAFGGAIALRDALRAIGPTHVRHLSAIRRWNTPIPAGGSGGEIPSRALVSVKLAARALGVTLPEPPAPSRPETLPPLSVSVLPVTAVQPRIPIVPVLDDHEQFWDDHQKQEHCVTLVLDLLGPAFGHPKILAGFSQRCSKLRLVAGYMNMAGAVKRVRREIEKSPDSKFVVYAETGDLVAEVAAELRDVGAFCIHKNATLAVTKRFVAKFQGDPCARVLVCAAAQGTALTAATHVIFLEFSWCADAITAAAKRVHRLGNTKPLQVYFVAAKRSRLQLELCRALADELRRYC